MTTARYLVLSALAFSLGVPAHAFAQQASQNDAESSRTGGGAWRSAPSRSTNRRSAVIRVVQDETPAVRTVTPTSNGSMPQPTTQGTTTSGTRTAPNPNSVLRTSAQRTVTPPAAERRVGSARFSLRSNLRTPLDFGVAALNEGGVRLSWTDVAGNETANIVQRVARAGSAWGTIEEMRLPANVTEFGDEPPAGLYAYRVASASATGRSWFSPWRMVESLGGNIGGSDQNTSTDPGSGQGGNPGSDPGSNPGAGGNPGTNPGGGGAPQPPALPSIPGLVQGLDNGGRSAMVTWQASTGGAATSYQLERSPARPSGVVTLQGTQTSFLDASGAGQFAYRVRAVGAAGTSEYSPWISLSVADITPASPTDLTVLDLGDHESVRCAWTDASDNETSFVLRRQSMVDGFWGEETTINVSANRADQTDNPGPGTYRYAIAASNGVGTSDPTAWFGVIISPLGGEPQPGQQTVTAPSSLVAVDSGSRGAQLTWVDASDNETAFEVERNPAFAQGRIRVSGNQTTMADASGVGTFAYRVRAANGQVVSEFTPWVSVGVADTTPEGPTGLGVSDLGTYQAVSLAWADHSDNESGFRIERQTMIGSDWGGTRSIITLPNVTSQSDSPGPGTHRYRIAAINASGVSAFTAWEGVEVAQPPVDPATLPPSVPTGMVALDQGNRRAGVSWFDHADNELGFQLERNPGFASGQVVLGANITAYVDEPGAGSFAYRVRAFNNAGYSNWSEWGSVNVAETLPAAPDALVAQDAGNQSEVELSWGDNSFNEEGFRIEACSWTGSDWSQPETFLADADETTFVDSPGLGRFRYRVQSFNAGGNSPWTEWQSVSVTDGWTPIVASADTRRVFVSSSTGNDASDGLTEATAKRTLSAGFALLRSGYPDHLLLKRGDTWQGEHIGELTGTTVGAFNKRGRSATEPMVVSSYGDSPERPLVRSSGRPWCINFQSGGGVSFVNLIGLHLVGEGCPQGIRYWSQGGNILIEDCKVEKFSLNISFESSNPAAAMVSNLVIRRSVVADSYSSNSHSQGIYTSYVDGLLIDECVFDHNGWSDTVADAESTMFNHNMYLNRYCRNITVRNTISARGSATGIQMRGPGMHAVNNLALANPLGITMGHDEVNYPTEFASGTMMDNVVLDSADIGLGGGGGFQHLPRGFGMCWGKSKDVTVSGNIIAHNTGSTGDEPGLSTDRANENVLVERNIVYDWRGSANTGVTFRAGTQMGASTTLRNNKFQQPTGGRLVRLMQPLPGANWTGNSYYSQDPSTSGWYLAAGSNISVQEWITRSSEQNLVQTQVNFPDPSRTIGSYMQTLSMPASMVDFLQQARMQSRTNWRPEFTAQAVNAYIRAGFGMSEPGTSQASGNN